MPKCMGAGKAISDMINKKLKPEDFIHSFLPSRFDFSLEK